jgi:hypothetical protein
LISAGSWLDAYSHFILQRRRVFLGCEGESEQGYGALLRRLLETRRQDVHLDVVLLRPGGGDPLALIELAQRLIANSERKREAPYALRAVLLDSDKLGQVPERDARIDAAALGIKLIWQEPCHEALLLRHLAGCRYLRPATPDLAMAELAWHWPEYTKGLSAMRLAERIGENEVRYALQVELGLAGFLSDIGFI